jgi:hypothetical protein
VSPEWSSEQAASRSKAPTIFLCSFIAFLQGLVRQNRAMALPHYGRTGAGTTSGRAVAWTRHTAQAFPPHRRPKSQKGIVDGKSDGSGDLAMVIAYGAWLLATSAQSSPERRGAEQGEG